MATRQYIWWFTDTSPAYPSKAAKPKDQWITGGTIGFRTNKINAWYRLDYLHRKYFAAGAMNFNSYRGFLDSVLYYEPFPHQLQAEWNVNSKLQINGAAFYLVDYKRNTEKLYH